MKPVQKYNFFYWFLRPLVCFGAICHYKTFTIRGRQNLPRQGGYILAPNHQQALMEPLAVLSTVKKSPVFVARADIFNNPTIREVLLFLKIMPVYRIRDGKDSLGKNAEIFDASRAVVVDGYPFCMMAEGRHNDKHQLLPLVKGMFRIAGETQKQLGSTPLFIVPVGIDVDEYEEPFSNMVINIGEPIGVQQFMETYTENEPVALNQMREAVAEGIKHQMFDIRSKEHYEEILTVCDMANERHAWSRFLVRQRDARRLDALEGTPRFDRVMDKVRRYRELCAQVRLSPKREARHWSLVELALSLAVVIGGVASCVMFKEVLWLVCFLLACYPILIIPTHRLIPLFIKDTQFRSSVNFGIRFFFSVIYTLVFSIILGCVHGWQWWLIAFNVPFVMAWFSGPLTEWTRGLWYNIRYWILRLTRPATMRELRQLRKEIQTDII